MSNCYKYYKRDSVLKVTDALAHRILINPIITEKALKVGSLGYVSFLVGKEFNKSQIKKAFSLVYDGLISNVVKVNIINQKGKVKRNMKRVEFKRPGFKKAMILVKISNNEALMNSIYGGEK